MLRFLDARVGDYMSTPVISVAPETPLHELDRRFAAHDFNCFPVVDARGFAGVVTKFDVLRAFVVPPGGTVPRYADLSRLTAAQIMTREAVVFRPDTPLGRVLQTLVDFRLRSFPVVQGRQVVGMIARQDIVRALHASGAASV